MEILSRRPLAALALAALVLALGACHGPPARTTELDQVLATEGAAAVMSATPGSLVVTILHLRAPARDLGDLPDGTTAIHVPAHLRIDHPHAISQVDETGKIRDRPFDPTDATQFDPRPPARRKGSHAPPPPTLFAILVGRPFVFASAGDMAVGWTGVGPRVWVRSCRHGKPGNVDLSVDDDEISCLDTAWFPGVDSLFLRETGTARVIGDPGHEGIPVIVIRGVR